MKLYFTLLALGLFSCFGENAKIANRETPEVETTLNSTNTNTATTAKKNQELPDEPAAKKHFEGALIGGFKGDQISFDLSADGKKLENLTFKGYWRCSGKLEQLRAVGPDGFFAVINGVAKGHISDPPDGGSTAWRFDIDVKITGKTATGTFRMNINNLGCDSYLLKFTATAK